MKENPWLSADTDNLPAGTMSLLEGTRYNGEQNGSRWTLHRLGPNYSDQREIEDVLILSIVLGVISAKRKKNA